MGRIKGKKIWRENVTDVGKKEKPDQSGSTINRGLTV